MFNQWIHNLVAAPTPHQRRLCEAKILTESPNYSFKNNHYGQKHEEPKKPSSPNIYFNEIIA